MKKNNNTKKNIKRGWYLVYDGVNTTITNDIAEAQTLKTVIIEITADEAAQILLLANAYK